jgi:hypothetical protein
MLSYTIWCSQGPVFYMLVSALKDGGTHNI